MQNGFKTKYSFKDRLSECSKIKNHYPDRVPVICEKARGCKGIELLDKIKYLVPITMKVCEFIMVIKKRLKMSPNFALFFMTGGVMLSGHMLINDVYNSYKFADGFLYVVYAEETVFGNP